MSEQMSPEAPPRLRPGDTIYTYANNPQRTIRKRVHGMCPRGWVAIAGRSPDERTLTDRGLGRRVSPLIIFTAVEAWAAISHAGDLPDVNQPLDDMLLDAEISSELAAALGRAAARRRSEPDPGRYYPLWDVASLLGDAERLDSNVWRVETWRRRAKGLDPSLPAISGRLELAEPFGNDVSVQERGAAEAINRKVLDHLYGMYDVANWRAYTAERMIELATKPHLERKVVYPTLDGYSFVETATFAHVPSTQALRPPDIFEAHLVPGFPHYTHDGYTITDGFQPSHIL